MFGPLLAENCLVNFKKTAILRILLFAEIKSLNCKCQLHLCSKVKLVLHNTGLLRGQGFSGGLSRFRAIGWNKSGKVRLNCVRMQQQIQFIILLEFFQVSSNFASDEKHLKNFFFRIAMNLLIIVSQNFLPILLLELKTFLVF